MLLKRFKVDAVLVKVTIVTETESNSTNKRRSSQFALNMDNHKHLEGGSSGVTR